MFAVFFSRNLRTIYRRDPQKKVIIKSKYVVCASKSSTRKVFMSIQKQTEAGSHPYHSLSSDETIFTKISLRSNEKKFKNTNSLLSNENQWSTSLNRLRMVQR